METFIAAVGKSLVVAELRLTERVAVVSLQRSLFQLGHDCGLWQRAGKWPEWAKEAESTKMGERRTVNDFPFVSLAM